MNESIAKFVGALVGLGREGGGLSYKWEGGRGGVIGGGGGGLGGAFLLVRRSWFKKVPAIYAMRILIFFFQKTPDFENSS